AIVGPQGGNVGIGFAVPVNLARRIMDDIVHHGRVRRGWVGMTLQNLSPERASELHVSSGQGAFVAEVLPNSPAERGGIRQGDMIVTIDEAAVQSAGQLRNKI